MSGLAVIFRPDGGPVDPARIATMQAASAHRGRASKPWTGGGVGLGHQRGAASMPDDQPAHARDGDLHLVMHGRLYNHAEVVQALRDDGAALDASAAASTTATILAAYGRWGRDMAARLDGDFALALYDGRRGGLLCVRDALGVKPLYHARLGDAFLAATEQKQLLAAGVPSTPDEGSIAGYLAIQAGLADGPRTFYRDIRALEPGRWLWVDGQGQQEGVHWEVDVDARPQGATYADRVEVVRELMLDAVRRRLPAEPPFACALSGGLDSSSVTGLCRRVLEERGRDDPLLTFAFEFNDPEADEPELIRAVAERAGARHVSAYVDTENVFDCLPRLIRAADEPTRDMGLMLLWRKKELAARAGVSVLLSGLGGDELFQGRHQYFADLLKGGRWLALWREIDAIYPVDTSTGRRTSRRRLFTAHALAPLLSRPLKHWLRRRLTSAGTVGAWVHPEFARREGLAERLAAEPPRRFRDHYRHYALEVLRCEVQAITFPIHDALNAAFGLDTRFPILDRRLVQQQFASPRKDKLAMGRSRIIQREAMQGFLPAAVLQDHVKKNFHPALERQQREHFRVEIEALLGADDLASATYVDWDFVRRSYGQQLERGGWYPLWNVLNLEHWLRALDGGSPTTSGDEVRRVAGR